MSVRTIAIHQLAALRPLQLRVTRRRARRNATHQRWTHRASLELLEPRELLSVSPQLLDIGRIPADGRINEFAEINGTVFFGANDGLTGDELWKTKTTNCGRATARRPVRCWSSNCRARAIRPI